MPEASDLNEDRKDRVMRYATFKLDGSDRRRRAEDGALIVPGRLARVGVQTYAQGDGTSLIEYRPPTEVFGDESISSFDGLTITDLHPTEGMVTPQTYRSHSRGHIQNPRQDGDWLAVDFFIKDAELISSIDAGERQELSAGYLATLDMTPGEDPKTGTRYDAVQRNIRGNHAALLPAGHARAGRQARLLDSAGDEIPVHAPTKPPMGRENRKMDEFTVTIGDIAFTLKGDATAQQAIGKHMASMAAVVADRDRERARADDAEQKVADVTKQLADATDPVKLEAAAKARSELADSARKVAKNDDLDVSGSDREIMARALDAAGVTGLEDQSDDYIRARFDARLDVANTAPTGTTVSQVTDSLVSTTPTRPKQRFARLAAVRKAAIGGM